MNKKALITGGSRGIGKGIAYSLAAEGYDIAFSYSSKAEAARAVSDDLVQTYGVRCFCYQAKLELPGAAKALFDQAVNDLGGLDVLVNNAGLTIFEPLGKLTENALDFMINLDFKSFLLMMNYAAEYMIEHKVRGNIINITSSRGERAYPEDGLYGGLKAGLNRAIQSFALDVAGYGIRINNVAPGAIRVRTNEERIAEGRDPGFWDELGTRIPLGRAGLPEDIGNAVAYLVSDKASYVTGITQRVDGGLILPGPPEDAASDAAAWGSGAGL